MEGTACKNGVQAFRGRFPGMSEGPDKSPRPGVAEEEAEEWGLRHPSHLHTKQLYFSMSYKWGFTDTFHVGKGFFVKRGKEKRKIKSERSTGLDHACRSFCPIIL